MTCLLSDFHAFAQRFGLQYLGVPNKQLPLCSGLLDLDAWCDSTRPRISLQAIMTETWSEWNFTADHPESQAAWWKLPGCQPFQASLLRAREALKKGGRVLREKEKLQFGVNVFKNLARMLRITYAGVLVHDSSSIGGGSSYHVDPTLPPVEPPNVSPSRRPVYWEASSGAIVFASIADLLHKGFDALLQTKKDYDDLAMSLNYVYLGSEAFDGDGHCIKQDTTVVMGGAVLYVAMAKYQKHLRRKHGGAMNAGHSCSHRG